MNTDGFKRDDLIVGDFMRVFDNVQENLPIKNHTTKAARYLNHALNRVPIISDSYTDFAQGGIAKTDNPLDFALNKENLFFAIETPEGVRYTRNGSFVVNEDGYLATKEGYRVLSKGSLDSNDGILIPQDSLVEVDNNGNVFFRTPDNEVAQNGAIAVVSFVNQRNLIKQGHNLYKYPEDKLDQRIEPDNTNAIIQGALEKSNVNAIVEMTGLIETNRLVDMYSKVLKTHMDDLNSEAISRLAVRA